MEVWPLRDLRPRLGPVLTRSVRTTAGRDRTPENSGSEPWRIPVTLKPSTSFSPSRAGAAERPHPASAGVTLDVGAVTDVGRKCANNEDHYLIIRFGRVMETLRTNLSEGQVPIEFGEVGYGFAVADGMGGAAAGEVASSLAIVTGVNLALNHPKWTTVISPQEIQETMERWRDRFRQIDAVLTERRRADPELSGMGTTLTVACTLGPHLLIYHVGDSRAYIFRRGRLHCLNARRYLRPGPGRCRADLPRRGARPSTPPCPHAGDRQGRR